MKKSLFAFIAVLGLVGLFSACSSDGDNKENFVVDEALLGQWNLSKEATTIQWDPKEGIPNEEFSIHLPEISALGMPEQDLQLAIIPLMGPVIVNPMLSNLLQNISFLENGDIIATYAENGAWVNSPKGLISYGVIAKNEILSVKLSAENIIAQANITDKEVIKALKKAFKERISLKYSIENEALSIFIDKDSLNDFLPRIKSILSGLKLEKETLDLINGILVQMPDVLNKTEVFKFGLNLDK